MMGLRINKFKLWDYILINSNDGITY